MGRMDPYIDISSSWFENVFAWKWHGRRVHFRQCKPVELNKMTVRRVFVIPFGNITQRL